MAEISPLRRRMIEDMTVRNLSPATQRSYLAAVSKLSRYFGRSPDCLELEDIRAFQVHLVAIGISWPALNQIVCALRFFYGVTLGHDAIPERISYARQPSKLPVVLSADEVVRFLEAIPSLKSRTALTTVYAAGLRVSEVVLLKIADIDSQRMVIRVEQGKGGKDRYVMLSPQLLRILRSYWRLARPQRWMFPGRDEDRPLDPSALFLKLAAGDWIRARHNLLVTGPCGVGKSWLACALGNRACRDDFSVAYHRVPRLFAALALGRADGRYTKMLRAIARLDLLILDDWGPEPLDADQRRDLLEIVEDRYEARSIIVTSQLPVDRWYEIIGNPTIADAILDRLVHNAYRIDLNGESLRKQKQSAPGQPAT